MTATIKRAGQAAKQTGWLLAGTVLARIAGLVAMIVIVDVVGFEGLGRLTKVIFFVSTINSFADFRTVEAIVQHFQEAVRAQDGGRARAILRFCLRLDVASGFVAALLAIGIAVPLTNLVPGYDDADYVGLIAIFSLSLLVSTANVAATTTLRVFERFAFVGLEEGFGGVFRRLLVIGAALWFQSVPAILWAYVAGAFVQAAVLVSTALRTVNEHVDAPERMSLDRDERRGLLRFMVGTNVLSSVAKLGEQADVLMVSLVMSDAATGIYRLAVAARELVAAPLIALNRVAYPRIARSVSAGVDELRSELRSLRPLGTMIGIAGGLITAIGADALFQYVLSRNDPYGDAPTILRVMLIGTTASAMYFWPGFVVLANRHTASLTKVLAVVTALTVVGATLAVSWFGLIGAAAAYALAMVARGVGQRWLCDHHRLI